MFSMIFPMENKESIMNDEMEEKYQLGGGGSLEERCSSITFEDILPYTHAHFDVVVNNDWNSAQVEARAWINGTSVDLLREKLDSYLEELYPSGGDGWISTDEKSAVEAVASECIEYAMTRIGLRESTPHRGGVGLDWKNATWQNNGVIIEEWNLVPSNHADIRDCATIGSSSDCLEVPVFPNSERDCDILIDASESEDECRLELWMNATMEIPSMGNGDEFTFAFNASNMTNAVLEFTFPNNPNLRIDMWEECEGRNVEFQPTSHEDAPLRGACVGDDSSTYLYENNDDEGIKFILMPHRSRDFWPLGEDIFVDFTTEPIPINNPPLWKEGAPSDGAWFPSLEEGQIIWADWNSISSWFDDEKPISQLQVNCNSESSANILQLTDKSFSGTINFGNDVQVECEAVDDLGQSSGIRTWNLGIPISLTTTSENLANPHTVDVQFNENWPELSLEYAFTQSQNVNSENIESVSISSNQSLSISSSGMIPGSVDLWVRISGGNLYSAEKIYSLGITKESSPPMISVTEYGWEIDIWQAQGQFSDPDGEDVDFSLSVDGLSAGTVSVSGNSWSTPMINFGLWDKGEHDVLIIGCDTSAKCNEVLLKVNNSHLFESDLIEPDVSDDGGDTGLLPGFSMLLALLSLTVGLIYSTRRH